VDASGQRSTLSESEVYALKGHDRIAQGNALGRPVGLPIQALKGRANLAFSIAPFQGLLSENADAPGRILPYRGLLLYLIGFSQAH
jgi:hypothetical protein